MPTLETMASDVPSLVEGTPRLLATYLLETPLELADAAAALAREQSSGTFVSVPGETSALRARFAARVESVAAHEDVAAPSLPGAMRSPDGRYRRGEVVVSWPWENVGANLPTLLTTVWGNLTELRELSGVRLLDLKLPEALVRAYRGPQFGVSGTRRLAAVHGRPIVGTIVKPSVGLSPEDTARLVRELAMAGIDFVKDDELIANPPWSPLERRVDAVMKAVEEAADEVGRRVMVAFNITDDLDAMLSHHEYVVGAGGSCVMVSINSVGLAGVERLRREAAVPIHGHRNGWGALTRSPMLGMDFPAYQRLWRLAGVDHLHVNGIAGKFWEPDESVARSIRACLAPMPGTRAIMPAVSSGQWGGQAPDTYRLSETVDLIYLAGAGIVGHPGGPGAGVEAIREAWRAAVAGVPLPDRARSSPELAAAIAFFGGCRSG